MIAIKTILLPTDGSECSGRAMAYAFSFAKQYGARVVALHVIDQRWEDQTRRALAEVGYEVLKLGKEGLEGEGKRILSEVAKAAESFGVACETRIVTGIPIEVILRLSEDLPADLIILGTHGRTGIAHALLGSVAERVVRRASCPVITVRQEEHESVAPDLSA